MAALYLGLNLVFIYATPLESMKGVIAVGSLSASHLFGPDVAGVFSALMALCIVSTVNAEVTVGPRVYYAMAKNRAFFSAAATVHPRWHTPVVAILSQGLCAMLMTLPPFPDLVTYIGMSLTLFTVLLGGRAVHVPPHAAGLAAAARRGFRLPADSRGLYPGGHLHDGLRRDPAAPGIAAAFGHRRRRRAGLPLRHPPARLTSAYRFSQTERSFAFPLQR